MFYYRHVEPTVQSFSCTRVKRMTARGSNLRAYANIYAMALMRATVASLLANLESLLTIKSCRDDVNLLFR